VYINRKSSALDS